MRRLLTLHLPTPARAARYHSYLGRLVSVLVWMVQFWVDDVDSLFCESRDWPMIQLLGVAQWMYNVGPPLLAGCGGQQYLNIARWPGPTPP